MERNFLERLQNKVTDKFNDIKSRKMKQMIEEFVLPIVEPKLNEFFDLIDNLQRDGSEYSLTLTYSGDYLNIIISKVIKSDYFEVLNFKVERGDLINLAFDEKKLEEIISKLKTIK